MTAKAQPWDAPFPELTHQRRDLITKPPGKALKPRGKDAARFWGCPPKVKQSCLERSKNSEILAEKRQIPSPTCVQSHTSTLTQTGFVGISDLDYAGGQAGPSLGAALPLHGGFLRKAPS